MYEMVLLYEYSNWKWIRKHLLVVVILKDVISKLNFTSIERLGNFKKLVRLAFFTFSLSFWAINLLNFKFFLKPCLGITIEKSEKFERFEKKKIIIALNLIPSLKHILIIDTTLPMIYMYIKIISIC